MAVESRFTNKSKQKTLTVIMIACVFSLSLFYQLNISDLNAKLAAFKEDDFSNHTAKDGSQETGYLVWSPQCRMISLDPFESAMMKLFKKQTFKACSEKLPLTSIEQNFEEDVVRLVLHQDRFNATTNSSNVRCCYESVYRLAADKQPDKNFHLEKAKFFTASLDLPSGIESIIVTCTADQSSRNQTKRTTIYKNGHTFIRRKPEKVKAFNEFKTLYEERPLSVLMIGIDSVSRLNFYRALPKTAAYIRQSDWFELEGYNKVGYNTFPNLMAIHTGINFEEEGNVPVGLCNSSVVGGLNKCPFLFYDFERSGFVTAYAEDDQWLTTFNYCKKGFKEQPTTHYFKTFALAAEKFLSVVKRHTLRLCLGFQFYGEYIFQQALDFASAYRTDPFFGLFWTNTFSHDDASDVSGMDGTIESYLKQLESRGILETSCVIFFSDHGNRYGPMRQKLHSGWFEERLPFLFIWLPQWFKDAHPEFVESLEINKNRLTSPFDIHMTLKHILELSGRIFEPDQAVGCPLCQSIFREIPWNRSCSDAGITHDWCTCSDYKPENKTGPVVKKSVLFVLDWINNKIKEKTENMNMTEAHCATLTLKSIDSAYSSEFENSVEHLVKFDVHPSKASFEATVRIHREDGRELEIIGKVSRLNKYGKQGNCVNDSDLRNYCFCEKNDTKKEKAK